MEHGGDTQARKIISQFLKIDAPWQRTVATEDESPKEPRAILAPNPELKPSTDLISHDRAYPLNPPGTDSETARLDAQHLLWEKSLGGLHVSPISIEIANEDGETQFNKNSGDKSFHVHDIKI